MLANMQPTLKFIMYDHIRPVQVGSGHLEPLLPRPDSDPLSIPKHLSTEFTSARLPLMILREHVDK